METWDIGNNYSVAWNGGFDFQLLKHGENVLSFTIIGSFPTLDHAKSAASEWLWEMLWQAPDSSG